MKRIVRKNQSQKRSVNNKFSQLRRARQSRTLIRVIAYLYRFYVNLTRALRATFWIAALIRLNSPLLMTKSSCGVNSIRSSSRTLETLEVPGSRIKIPTPNALKVWHTYIKIDLFILDPGSQETLNFAIAH
jgi:hypothetical protein